MILSAREPYGGPTGETPAPILEAMRSVRRIFLSLMLFEILLIPAGVVMVAHGVAVFRDHRITCGEHVMKPGDTCTNTAPDSDAPAKQTYEDMEISRTVEEYAFTILGALLIAGGATTLILHRPIERMLRRLAEGTADES
jgi:hypothetical protein